MYCEPRLMKEDECLPTTMSREQMQVLQERKVVITRAKGMC
jgi:hypothetical protein